MMKNAVINYPEIITDINFGKMMHRCASKYKFHLSKSLKWFVIFFMTITHIQYYIYII